MSRINVAVHAEADWNVKAGPGLGVIVVAFHCPTCKTGREVRLQEPPWASPAADTGHDDFAGPDGHLKAGFAEYEKARAADDLPHDEHTEITTELWCPACMVGAAITVTA